MMDSLGSKREYQRRNHGKTINFIAPGVEKQARERRGGLLYGTTSHHLQSTDTSGRHSLTLSEQSSWERLRMAKQQRDAEEDLQNHHEVKQQARVQAVEEKRKDLQLLQQYNPWGKPAPGAPRWTQSGTLLARGDAPISRQGERSRQEERSKEGDRSTGRQEEELGGCLQLGRPGGGAPLKSRDGHVDASMKVHPETRFQKHLHREVENSLRYRGTVDGQRADQPHLVRSESEEERESQKRSQQSRYSKRLEDQMEEAEERKRQQRVVSPLTYFPWGRSSPLRDDSGKLIARRRPRPHPPNNKFQSIVEHMERVGRREEPLMTHSTHPFTHGSKCKLQGGSTPTKTANDPATFATPERIAKQSQSLPVTALQREAEERQRERRREREENMTHRNSHHTLWEGGYQYQPPSLQL